MQSSWRRTQVRAEAALTSRQPTVRTRLADASLRGADLMDALASKTRIAGADFSGASEIDTAPKKSRRPFDSEAPDGGRPGRRCQKRLGWEYDARRPSSWRARATRRTSARW